MNAGYAMKYNDVNREQIEPHVFKVTKPGSIYTAIVDLSVEKNSTSRKPGLGLFKGNRGVIWAEEMNMPCASAWDIAVMWVREGVFEEEDFAK
jgi:hypothetical protein